MPPSLVPQVRTCDLGELSCIELERRKQELGLPPGDARNGGGASGSKRSSSQQGGRDDDDIDVPRQNGDKLWLFPRIKVGVKILSCIVAHTLLDVFFIFGSH